MGLHDQGEGACQRLAVLAVDRAGGAGRGRVIVRPSGTEQALRIMVEGEDGARVTELADALAALAAERLH